MAAAAKLEVASASDELRRSVADVRSMMERARADAASAAAAAAATAGAGATASDVVTALDGIRRELREELRATVAAVVADTSAGSPAAPASVVDDVRRVRAMLASSPLRDDVRERGARSAEEKAKAKDAEKEQKEVNEVAVDEDADEDPSISGPSNSAEDPSNSGPSNSGDSSAAPPWTTTPRASLGTSGAAASPVSSETQPQYSDTYMRVLAMLDKGETPPGIRNIDDKPPNPDAEIPPAKLERRRKPWETAENGTNGTNGTGGFGGGDASRPWLPSRGDDGGASGSGSGSATAGGISGGWRPPKVPSMSSEARGALTGKWGEGSSGGVSGSSSPAVEEIEA